VADVALVHAGQVRGRNLLAAPSDVLLPERLRQLAAATATASFSDATPEDDRPAASATPADATAAASPATASPAAATADASSATASPAAATASPATWLGAETRPCSQRGC
jgi:hypothetical protein